MKLAGLLDEKTRTACRAAAAIGAVTFGLGLKAAPARAMSDLLLGNVYFLGVAAFALVFLAIQILTKAGWPTLFRRVPEAMTAYLPAGAGVMVLVLAGSRMLYHWAHSEAVVHDEILHLKSGYLNLPGWALRTAIALFAWWAFARAIKLNSLRQDTEGGLEATERNYPLAAAYLVAFGATFTLASIDWVMSLEPHWYSTLYPWYLFSGAFVNAIAGVSVLTVLLHRRGYFPKLNEHHLHDLGKYLFGFGAFWAYLWFCQYLLIWYSNIPEETIYYAARSTRGWMFLHLINVSLNFLIPFGLLLRAGAKKRERALLAAGACFLVGRWVDLYIMVMPASFHGARPSWMDAPIFIGLAAVFVLLFDRAFTNAPPEPVNDPFLVESQHHHG